jgi:hypothetical protein
MTRAVIFLSLLLLAACSEEKPSKQAVNEMIESPLQSTVISSFYDYPPRPVDSSEGSQQARGLGQQNVGAQ